MKYLTLEHLYTHAFERTIVESTADFTDAINNIETETIDIVKTYLSRYYDVSKIFSDTPIRTGVLTKIMTYIIIYEAIKRNVYRKIKGRYEEDYKWAMEMLEKINAGKITLADLPEASQKQRLTKCRGQTPTRQSI
ncbi:phage protein Gp36 family protein [Capnocytophaga sp. ARDL2]|uniref:phage protein Gp36 family protein n=1 Tax=Capnocytophaga sp. ARDL2 TaxID=3238809 RepID=UPI0035577D12